MIMKAGECLNSFKRARQKANLTQAALSQIIHVSQGSISQWETGATSPDIKTMIALADLYGISMDELIGRTVPGGIIKDVPDERDDLSVNEKKLVKDFRALNVSGQNALLNVAESLAQNPPMTKEAAGSQAG